METDTSESGALMLTTPGGMKVTPQALEGMYRGQGIRLRLAEQQRDEARRQLAAVTAERDAALIESVEARQAQGAAEAEAGAAQQRAAQLEAAHNEMFNNWERASGEAAAEHKRAVVLEEFACRWTRHADMCPAEEGYGKCTCGYSEAFDAVYPDTPHPEPPAPPAAAAPAIDREALGQLRTALLVFNGGMPGYAVSAWTETGRRWLAALDAVLAGGIGAGQRGAGDGDEGSK